jgi:hypothetical protein
MSHNLLELLKIGTSINIENIKKKEQEILSLLESKKINKDKNYYWSITQIHDLFNISNLDGVKDKLKIYDHQNVIINGPLIRSIFTNSEYVKTINIYLLGDYVLPKSNNKEIHIKISKRKKYKSLEHFLFLQKDWQSAIIYHNSNIYLSTWALCELYNIKNYLNKVDPILNISKDYLLLKPEISIDVFDAIKFMHMKQLLKIQDIDYEKISDNKTPIEYALKLYSDTNNDRYLDIINILSNHEYRRHPFIFASKLNLNNNLTNKIKKIFWKYESQINLTNRNKEDNINDTFIDYFLTKDAADNLIDYLIYFNLTDKLNNIIFDSNCLNLVLKQKLVDKNQDNIIKSILITQNINLISLYDDNSCIIKIGQQILEELIMNDKHISFYYLWKNDNDIINTKFNDNNNILHMISSTNKLQQLVLKLKPDLLYQENTNNYMPIFYHISKNNRDVIIPLIEAMIDINITDKNNNNILHYLTKYNMIHIIKYLFYKHTQLICTLLNKSNSQKETPVLLASKSKTTSELVYLFIKHNCNTMNQDEFGNTMHHYLYLNSMCLDVENISKINIRNNYGFAPQDYQV